MTDIILVAIGSNLPDAEGRSPLDLCRWAVHRLAAQPGLSLDAVSAWYRTAPVPASDQPDFINGVVRLSGLLDPLALLGLLHEIEAEVGRIRSVANAARILDLDLLAVGARTISSAGLILPHPRLAERAFVLYPLCDVAPEWRHPTLGRTALQLRAALPLQRIERLLA
ncbi:MAG: 2-amino-4-hydroxy-6-hydroxymethyldihydropteridine diphosphokinase [Acetobacteraceae bacterium]|nr:2-amino-4-hydroxy-6-hydroxymethyldihydropteridine diphosphokinase [Acetobacteraceae bacterium]